jgi:ATP-dependent protease ClpP protease subunit
MMMNKSFAKSSRIAERFRTVKNWKPGALFAREQREGSEEVAGSLYVYTAIGGWFDGVTADSVRAALDGLKGIDVLNIYVNSEGGDVFEAKAIYSQLMRFSAKKVVHIDGIAASAASFIAMAGDEVIAAPESTVMIHDAWGVEFGNASKMREYADLLDMLSDDIAAIYSRKTGTPAAEFREMMKEDTWMTAQQALDKKLVDRIASYSDDDEDEPEAKVKSKFASLVEASHRLEMTNMEIRANALPKMHNVQQMQKGRASTVKR